MMLQVEVVFLLSHPDVPPVEWHGSRRKKQKPGEGIHLKKNSLPSCSHGKGSGWTRLEAQGTV